MAQDRRSANRLSSSISSSSSRTYYNKTFEDTADLFLFACSHGDYRLVDRLLQEGETDGNVSNKMGKSALQFAIENEHFEVVKVLLDQIPYEQFRDALLLAIYLGHTNIADFIMNHPTYRTFCGGFLDPTHPQAYDDSQFSSDITPLILAAQYNRLLIVHQLLSNGERIKKPHASMCPCIDCADSSASDSFRQAQVRLSAYKGLASEVYIALTYPDPILQAFELRHELRTLAKVEHYFREDYHKLSNQLSAFVTRLLDNIRGHDELDIILNKTGRPHEEKYENLARFDLAIQYREKAFVSHSNCQQKLMEKWYENLSSIKNAHVAKRLLLYLAFVFCLPFLSLAYFAFPRSKIGSLCHQPNLKLKAYIVSYFIFIALILTSNYVSIIYLEKSPHLSGYNSTIYAKYIQFIYLNDDIKNALIGSNSSNGTVDSVINCDISLRPMQPNPFQIAISVWVVGFIWQEFKQIFGSGMRVYLATYSNYIDCLMNVFYIISFICLYSTMIFTRASWNVFSSLNYWREIQNFNNSSLYEQNQMISQTRHILYWLNADRFYWFGGDLHNVAEAFFALGNVVSICRICFLLPIIGFVGPLLVVLERMMIDISKWVVIFVVLFFAFACSLYLTFSPYGVVLAQHEAGLQSFMNQSQVDTAQQTSSIVRNAVCPAIFSEILNGDLDTSALLTPNTDDNDGNNDNNNSTDFCSQDSNYAILKKVGHYPAITYFGESFSATILTIFFTLFGVIGENNVADRGYELITLTCFIPDPNTYAAGFDLFTSNLGFVLYGLFSFICVTVLINTLIAMMEESFDTIDDRADVEWKFSRSRLYMEYIRDGNTLPVPMNIFPSPKSIVYLVQRIRRLLGKITSTPDLLEEGKNVHRDDFDQLDGLNIPRRRDGRTTQSKAFKNKKIFVDRKKSYGLNEKLTYKIVIERIVKRFLLYYKNKNNGSDESNEGNEFKEFKNDISSFRFEMLNEFDLLDDKRISIVQSMKKFNNDLRQHFDFDQTEQY